MFGVLSLATNIFSPVSLFANCSPTELASIRQDLELEQKTLNSFVNGPTTEQVEDALKVQFEQDRDDDSSNSVVKKHLDKIKTFVDDYLQVSDAKVTNTINTKALKFDKISNEIKGILVADTTFDYDIDFTGDDNFSFSKERHNFRMSISSGQIIMTPYFEKNTESTEPIDDSNYATTANGAGVTDEQRKVEIVEMKRDKTEEYKKELEETKQDLQDLNYQTCSEIKTQAYSGGFDEGMARKYALNWAQGFNTNGWEKYREYKIANQTGGDCTNFVSQALRAGGIRFVNKGKLNNNINSSDNTNNWYHGDTNSSTSASWKGTQAFWQHFSQNQRNSRTRYSINTDNKNKIKDFVNDLGWGDVVSFDLNSNGIMDHTMIVTDFQWNNEYQKYVPLLSGHTDPVTNRSLVDLNIWKNERNATIYFNRPSND